LSLCFFHPGHEDPRRHLVRAGASNREWRSPWGRHQDPFHAGVRRRRRALRAGRRDASRRLFAVQVGMGENILILAFVVIVIAASARSAGEWSGAVLVGIVDTIGRAFLRSCSASSSSRRGGERRRPGDRLGDDLPPHGGGALSSGRKACFRRAR